MELLSPAYSERFKDAHNTWFGRKKTPTNPNAKMLWLQHRELNWDSTIRKYTPPPLRGIKPITREPWADVRTPAFEHGLVCAGLVWALAHKTTPTHMNMNWHDSFVRVLVRIVTFCRRR